MKHHAVLLATALLAAVPAFAAPDSDPYDNYVLTMPKVLAYNRAHIAFTAAAARDPSLKAESDAAFGNLNADLFDAMRKHPRLLAFFKAQGLTEIDAVHIAFQLPAACAQYVSPPTFGEITPGERARINFCKANHAAIQRLEFYSGQ